MNPPMKFSEEFFKILGAALILGVICYKFTKVIGFVEKKGRK